MDRKREDAGADSAAQLERFKEAARALGCDEDEAAFLDKLRLVARRKPKDEPKSPPTKLRKTKTASLLIGAALASGAVEAASPMAFSNSADAERFVAVAQSGPTPIVSVTLQLAQPSNVLVQFSSGATAETTKGCPCSIRALLRMDGGTLQPVKRINLGAPAAMEGPGHLHDRQSIDGSLVFPADAGTRTFELVVQQVTGASTDLRVYYPNLQAIAFLQ